jgi:hemoglobin/transferrin/lactoferrin receptor protein
MKFNYPIILFLAVFISANAQKIDTLKGVKFQDIVVSSTRFETEKNKIPNYIQRVDRAQILIENPTNMADLLQNSGRAFVQRSQGGGGSPILRGLEANRVLIVVDGVRMNNAIFRGGHLQNVLRVQPEMLENVEVFSGAGSMLYGSDALGGVLSFNSIKPKFCNDSLSKVNVNFLTRYAFANKENTILANLNYGNKNFASLTSFQISNYGDMRQGDNKSFLRGKYQKAWDDIGIRNRINGRDTLFTSLDKNVLNGTAYNQYNLLQKFSYKHKQFLHYLNFYYTTSSSVNRYDRLSEVRNGKPNFAEWFYGPETWAMISYQFSHFDKTKIYDQIKSTVAYQYFDESRKSRKWQSNQLINNYEHLDLITVNTDAKKMFNKTIFQYGLELDFNIVKSKANQIDVVNYSQVAAKTRYPDGGSKMNNYSIYANVESPMNETVNFIAGMRYNYNTLYSKFNDKTFFPFDYNAINQKNQSLSGQLSFLIKPVEGWKIAVTYSRGYRAPNVDDMSKVFESTSGTASRPGLLIIPNAKIKPEVTNTLECLIDYDIDKIFGVELNPFQTFISNWINLQATTLNGQDTVDYNGGKSIVVQNANVNNGYISGLSSNLYYKPIKSLTFRAGATITKGRIQLDTLSSPLDHVPPFYAFFNTNYQREKFSLQVSVLYNDAKMSKFYRLGAEDNEQYSADPINGFTPAWTIINLKGEFKITKEITFQTGVDNVMDLRYRTFASGVSGVGRNVFFALRGNF